MDTSTVPFQWLETLYIRVDDWVVRRHLRRTEQFLRTRPVNKLSREAVANRQRNLDVLRDYWQNTPLPRNTTHPGQRIPCFIDEQGHRCAVAHLVIESGSAEAAYAVAAQANTAYIHEMRFPVLDEWATQAGLSKDELALIQPTYGSPPPVEYTYELIHTAFYVLTVGFFIGLLGVPVSIWNFIRGMRDSRLSRILYWGGLFSAFAFYGIMAILLVMMATEDTVIIDWRATTSDGIYGVNRESCVSSNNVECVSYIGIYNVLFGLLGGSIFLTAAFYARIGAAPKLPKTSIATPAKDLPLPTLIEDAPNPPTG